MLSKSLKDTEKIAQLFLNKILKSHTELPGALVIGLSGDLGAGKTTFTKAIAQYLKVKNKITSPTFVIIKKYLLKNPKYKFLFHIDAYRLKNEQELLHLGWEEIISNKKHLVFIEWPENVAGVIPPRSRFIHISHTKDGHRNFKF